MAAHLKIAAAATAGGLVRMFLRPARSFSQTAMLMMSCTACGFFGTQPIMTWWALSVDYAGGIGALLGLLGISIAEGLLKAVDGFDFKGLLGAIVDFLTKGRAA